VSFTVQANPANTPRQAAISVGGQSFTVTQDGTP
jgi:hypothetical protein